MVAAGPILSGRQSDCSPVHIITARASTEAPGEGIIGEVADGIADSNSDVTREAVDYPAKLFPYDSSSEQGTQALNEQLTAYVDNCPESKVVLLGYSQGAHIIGDVLCGGGGVPGIGAESPPISTDIGDKGILHPYIFLSWSILLRERKPSNIRGKPVAAIIQMGDPRHIPGESYDVGTSKNEGVSILVIHLLPQYFEKVN